LPCRRTFTFHATLQLFFSPDFDLSHPDTFNAVMVPQAEGQSNADPRLYSRMIQDRVWKRVCVARISPTACSHSTAHKPTNTYKLSHYLDLVEVQLSTHISRRSERFFGAISFQEELSHDVTDACHRIATLRRELKAAQADLSHGNLLIPHLYSQRMNATVLHHKLSAISAVTSTQTTVQLLLAASDYVGALDLISTTLEILRTDLSGIHALR
jgi:hypothetical protein